MGDGAMIVARPDFGSIDLSIFADGRPMHERGVEGAEPGQRFVGLFIRPSPAR